ncbi:PKS ketosynthase [Streptomyces albus]|uniref:PKS ketosynthase n=1 Tax=Streptomyces albus (strain ATCC 21838 / DSM 41398 / FERM P-419 / JCM 4703 / NBRC 107858) TaxID=1081613 RepID=A0A0B5FA76_STRA4|nr:PKS ketosynthase [Streptomyces albus]AOU81670.1 hypothetical protein SLNHY_6979 [Streptomyces albus]AYN37359.1 type I polyketide synthase [Streptomyces albus]
MSNPTDQALLRAAETIRSLRNRVSELEGAQGRAREPIAVVAAGCRLPGGANSPEQYWQLLSEGRDAVRPLARERWAGIDFSALDDPAFARIPQHAGQLDRVDGFDAGFFGIGGPEADLMDPQQRLLLEVTWEAAERAGWNSAELTRSPTGVFVGVGHQDYLFSSLAARPEVGSRLSTGSGARSLLANRVSYEYGLRGPSMAVDTACSSSLVAIHLACQSLRSGGCDRALAGGVNLILSPLSTTMTGRALPLAPDGRTKAFAADADGMVRGEGVGLVALKRLSDALADGDPVEAIILADVTNQDGRTNGLTAPSPLAQEALLSCALDASGLRPRDITLVETHGTGTPLGDPIEYEAVRAVYGAEGDSDPTCWLGSVKANLGHLESAAGVASLIKVLGVIRHGQIPAQINLAEVSPFVELDGERFALPRRTEEWAEPRERRAAVSSFGFGGTNAHLIVVHPEALPSYRSNRRPARVQQPGGDTPLLLPVSARSGPALAAQAQQFARHFAELPQDEVHSAVAAAALRRDHHPWRLAVTAARPGDLAAALRRAADSPALGFATRAEMPRRLAFVYSGQAAQWPRECLRLVEQDEVVRAELTAWDEAVTRAGGPALMATLTGPDGDEALRDTRFAQLAIAAVQAALTARLRGWGVTPAAVCGHSVGEVSAALAAGALTRDQAVEVLLARGEALHRYAAGGAMYAVRAPAEEVAEALAKLIASGQAGADVGIAAVNSSQSTVVSGPADQLAALWEGFGAWKVTPLATDYAFHSPGLQPVAARLRSELAGLRPAPTRVPLYSTVTERQVPGSDLHAEHWAANAAGPVLFQQAVDRMREDGITCFVELGPHPALLPHLKRASGPGTDTPVAVSTLHKDRDPQLAMWSAAGELWAAGCDLDWATLYPGPRPTAALPTYPWQHRRHWLTGAGDAAAADEEADQAPRAPEDEEAILGRLVAHLADFMQTDSSALDPDRSARDLDIDSVSFVELKNRLESDLGTAIPITVLTEGASLREIARNLTAARGRRGPTSAEARDALDNLDDLSEDELDRLLAALDSEDGR